MDSNDGSSPSVDNGDECSSSSSQSVDNNDEFIQWRMDHNNEERRKRSNPNEAVTLSTAPEEPHTHWEQVVQNK